MRKIATLLASILVLTSTMFAQNTNMGKRSRDPFSPVYVFGSESLIEDPALYGIDERDPGISGCGKYFKFLKGDALRFDRIFIMIRMQETKPDVLITGLWETNSLRVRIMDDLGTPRLKILRGGEVTHALGEIRISKLDLDESPCLEQLKKSS